MTPFIGADFVAHIGQELDLPDWQGLLDGAPGRVRRCGSRITSMLSCTSRVACSTFSATARGRLPEFCAMPLNPAREAQSPASESTRASNRRPAPVAWRD